MRGLADGYLCLCNASDPDDLRSRSHQHACQQGAGEEAVLLNARPCLRPVERARLADGLTGRCGRHGAPGRGPAGWVVSTRSASGWQSSRAARPAPVAAALFVRTVIRPMSKVLNMVIVKFAGRRRLGWPRTSSLWAGVGHIYVAPATVQMRGDVILVALTLGNQPDPAPSLRAAGGCRAGSTAAPASPAILSSSTAGKPAAAQGRLQPVLRGGTPCSASSSSCARRPCPPGSKRTHGNRPLRQLGPPGRVPLIPSPAGCRVAFT
jgi:hypothetical protein